MDIVDIGGAPANEDCAQLGQTENFAAINRLEVDTYRAAIIDRPDVMDYVQCVEPGLGSWIEAGFPVPVCYNDAAPDPGVPPPLADIIVSALLITRPDDSGQFPAADFATLHGNLRVAYPEHAQRAAERLGITNFLTQGDMA